VPISYKARSKEEGKKLNWKHGVRCLLSIAKLRLTRPIHQSGDFWGQVARFFVSGSIGAGINIGMLYLLTEFGHLWYLGASLVAVTSSLVVSFILQKYWAFRSSETSSISHEVPMFALVAISNLFLNTLLLYLFVEHLHIWYVGAQAVASLLIAMESFVLYRVIFAPELWHGVRTLLRSRS
jgi:putative flippase GtrA